MNPKFPSHIHWSRTPSPHLKQHGPWQIHSNNSCNENQNITKYKKNLADITLNSLQQLTEITIMHARQRCVRIVGVFDPSLSDNFTLRQ